MTNESVAASSLEGRAAEIYREGRRPELSDPISKVGAALRFVSVGCLLAITGVVLLQVVARYVFGTSLVWSGELARLLLIAMTFTGLAWVQGRGDHIVVELAIPRQIPAPVAALGWLASRFVGAFVVAAMSWGCWSYASGLRLTTPALGIHLSIVFEVAAAGMALWAIKMIVDTVHDASTHLRSSARSSQGRS